MAQSIIIITTEVHKFRHIYVHVTISTINIINISVTSKVFSCPFITLPSCPALCDKVSFFIHSFSSLKPEQNGTHTPPLCPTHTHTHTTTPSQASCCPQDGLQPISCLWGPSSPSPFRSQPPTPVLSYLQPLGVPSSHSLWPPSLCTKWLIPWWVTGWHWPRRSFPTTYKQA